MLYLASTVTGHEPTSAEVDLWQEALEQFSSQEIEQAFKNYLKNSIFFPRPVQIKSLAAAIRSVDQTKKMLNENADIRERLKAAGEPYGVEQYRGFIQKALEIVKKIPSPDPQIREKLRRRFARNKQGGAGDA